MKLNSNMEPINQIEGCCSPFSLNGGSLQKRPIQIRLSTGCLNDGKGQTKYHTVFRDTQHQDKQEKPHQCGVKGLKLDGSCLEESINGKTYESELKEFKILARKEQSESLFQKLKESKSSLEYAHKHKQLLKNVSLIGGSKEHQKNPVNLKLGSKKTHQSSLRDQKQLGLNDIISKEVVFSHNKNSLQNNPGNKSVNYFSISQQNNNKELLSCFNENRRMFFTKADLSDERYYVTKNLLRIQDLSFERIGLFKQKQPQTHIRNLRFFTHDFKLNSDNDNMNTDDSLAENHNISLPVFPSKQILQVPSSTTLHQLQQTPSPSNNQILNIPSSVNPISQNTLHVPGEDQKRLISFSIPAHKLKENNIPSTKNYYLKQPNLKIENQTTQSQLDDSLKDTYQNTITDRQNDIQLENIHSPVQESLIQQYTNIGDEMQSLEIARQLTNGFASEYDEELSKIFFQANPKDVDFIESEDFKIQRKQILLDTILRDKKINQKDKKLIFENLLYQYNPKNKFYLPRWCEQMTRFLRTNQFNYLLEDAANRRLDVKTKKFIPKLYIFRSEGQSSSPFQQMNLKNQTKSHNSLNQTPKATYVPQFSNPEGVKYNNQNSSLSGTKLPSLPIEYYQKSQQQQQQQSFSPNNIFKS